jgi:predicted phage terminase large subunit-like protein
VSLDFEPIPLLDFIPALSPRWSSPRHLARLAEAFERADRGPVAVFGTTPPRHGKTELEKHAIVRRLLLRPDSRIGFCSYAARAAYKRSREIRKLFLRAQGAVERGAASVADWRTGVEDGGLWAGGVDGGWTGEGFDLIVVDDPIKGRAEAESAVEREHLWEFFRDDLETRLMPGGSIIVIHTRWTVDDLGGRITSSHVSPVTGVPYEHIRLAALREDGTALWPDMFPVDALERIKAAKGAYAWESLYQGRPFPRGGRVFGQHVFYDELPSRLRIAIGIDLASTAKTSADHSVAIVVGIDDSSELPVGYILDVIRQQEEAPRFGARLAMLQAKYTGVTFCWYYAGNEKGIAQFVQLLGVDIDLRPAAIDKFIRAQPVAAAWNDGRVRIPREAPWLDDLLAELVSFTGTGDKRDDQADALAGAWDSADQPSWITAMTKWREQGGVL